MILWHNMNGTMLSLLLLEIMKSNLFKAFFTYRTEERANVKSLFHRLIDGTLLLQLYFIMNGKIGSNELCFLGLQKMFFRVSVNHYFSIRAYCRVGD